MVLAVYDQEFIKKRVLNGSIYYGVPFVSKLVNFVRFINYLHHLQTMVLIYNNYRNKLIKLWFINHGPDLQNTPMIFKS